MQIPPSLQPQEPRSTRPHLPDSELQNPRHSTPVHTHSYDLETTKVQRHPGPHPKAWAGPPHMKCTKTTDAQAHKQNNAHAGTLRGTRSRWIDTSRKVLPVCSTGWQRPTQSSQGTPFNPQSGSGALLCVTCLVPPLPRQSLGLPVARDPSYRAGTVGLLVCFPHWMHDP